MTPIPTPAKNQEPTDRATTAPNWRDVFASAIRDCDEDTYEAEADAILAAIAERGYRLHRDHDWMPTGSLSSRVLGLGEKCRRCGVEKPGLSDGTSCEGGS